MSFLTSTALFSFFVKTSSAKGIPWEEKVPFLLVRFLWANKENEQYNLNVIG
jgi:hypothetical protein